MEGALGALAIGTGYLAILSPALIIWVVFHYVSKLQKNKNETLVNIAKTINDPEQVREIVDQLNQKKKPTDLRKARRYINLYWIRFSWFWRFKYTYFKVSRIFGLLSRYWSSGGWLYLSK